MTAKQKEGWRVAGKPDGERPKVGTIYTVRDSRKGTFTGKVLSVNGEWAEVEITEGKARFISMPDAEVGDTVTVRDCLCIFAEPTT